MLWQLRVHAMDDCICEPEQTLQQLKVYRQVELFTPNGANYELSILKVIDLDQAGNKPKLEIVWQLPTLDLVGAYLPLIHLLRLWVHPKHCFL